MFVFSLTLLSSLLLSSICSRCPDIYLRYSQDHSFCKPKNATCPIYTSGVDDIHKKLILALHNKYRSLVATGKEGRAGKLPQAANMIQMVWDKELEGVAQRYAEQCIYAHDCSNCRRVENFSVGQNIAFKERQCSGVLKCGLNREPQWESVLSTFYEEVQLFDKAFVRSMMFPPGRDFGHFTQMLWAETWRIGCGFVAFQKQNGYRQLYVCNYGPSGNIVKQPMYQIGPPCSACPLNSFCEKSSGSDNYEVLCSMNQESDAPLYPPKRNFLFYCDFRSSSGDCAGSSSGQKKWKIVKALGGHFVEIVLVGGETSTLTMKKKIKPNRRFCLIAMYRIGPTVAGQQVNSNALMSFSLGNTSPINMELPKSREVMNFFRYNVNLGWSLETQVSVTFSVPRGAPSQFFNLQLLSAVNGRCQT